MAHAVLRVLYASRNLTDLKVIPVETSGGLIHLEILDDNRVRVNMGVPQFEPRLIPLDTDQFSAINIHWISMGGLCRFQCVGYRKPAYCDPG